MNHRAENDRGDHHFDEFDEAVPQWLEGLPKFRKESPDHDPCGDRHQNLNIENSIPWSAGASLNGIHPIRP
jgi:hypothetical protein